MNLCALPLADLQAMYSAALAALHDLSIGGRVQSVSLSQGPGGRSVSYSTGTITDLRRWIGELESAIANCGSLRRRGRAIGFRF